MPFDQTNLNIKYYRGTEQLNHSDIIVNLDDKSNLEYIPSTVHKIYNTNVIDISDFSSDVNIDQDVILTSQDIRSENGIYKQTATSTATKQTAPTKNTFFLDVSSEYNKAVFTNNNYFSVNFNKVLLGASIQTTSATSLSTNRIFDYPVPFSKPSVINTNIVGYSTSDDEIFDGEYKIVFYNTAGTSILKLDNFTVVTNRTDNLNFTLPTVSFGVSMGTSGGNIDLISNNNKTVDWYVKSEILF